MTKKSPKLTHFKISEIRLLDAQYSINTDIDPPNSEDEQESSIKVDFKCSYKFDDKNLTLNVILGVSTKGDLLPFRFAVDMGGVFILDSKPNARELDAISNIYCPAVIYPFLREFVADLIKRGGDEPFYLPILNFQELYKKSQKEAEEKSETDSKPT